MKAKKILVYWLMGFLCGGIGMALKFWVNHMLIDMTSVFEVAINTSIASVFIIIMTNKFINSEPPKRI